MTEPKPAPTLATVAAAIQDAADAFNAAVEDAFNAGYVVRWWCSTTQGKLPASITDVTVSPPHEWMNK